MEFLDWWSLLLEEFTVAGKAAFAALAPLVTQHRAVRLALASYRPRNCDWLEKEEERRLATYVIRISEGSGALGPEPVTAALYRLLQEVFLHVSESQPMCLFDHYPLLLAQELTGASAIGSFYIARAVQRLVRQRQYRPFPLPPALRELLGGNTPLIGGPSALMNSVEKEALLQFLGTRSSVYLEIFMNGLYAFTEATERDDDGLTTESRVRAIASSPWYYLVAL